MKKTLFKNLVMIILALSLNFSLTLAQTVNNTQPTPPPIIPAGVGTVKIPNQGEAQGQGASTFLQSRLLPTITSSIIGLTGGVGLVLMIVGGIQMMASRGEPEEFAKGRKTVTFSLVGILIAILSYAIVAIITAIKI